MGSLRRRRGAEGIKVASSTNLDVSFEKAKGLERRLTVRVPNAEIDREVDARLMKMGKTARIKGFRPGKVPTRIVRQRFGVQIRQEVLADVIRASFSRAVSQAQLNPAGGPAIEALPAPDDAHFIYRATFEVYPEIELKGIDKLSVERPQVEINDVDVANMIERLRAQRATWRTVEREAAEGDRVLVDFVGKIDDEPFEGSEGKDVLVVIGAGQVIEDFDKALRGLAAGARKSAKVKFPKEYGVANLAGKKAVFDIDVKQIEEKALPDLDEEFFAAFGVTEGGVDELKTEVRKNMQRELDERLRAETKTRALNALLEANKIDVPNALVLQEIHNLQADAMQRMGIQDPQQAPAAENFREAALKRVQLGLLVQELIAAHKIELDRGKVDRRIEELTAPYEKPQEAAQLYRSSRELMAQVESSVLEDQVVAFLLEQGKPKQKTLSFEEFMGMGVAK
jgi:trigger factor